MKRQTYLSMKSLEEAKELILSRFGSAERVGVETLESTQVLGRVTAEPVFARRSSPTYHSAAMDGIAVRAEETFGATDQYPKVLEIGRHAVWVNTGQPLPPEFDSVIMVEQVHQVDEGHLEIMSAARPWQHVRKVGEDIVATQLLFPLNHLIRPYDLAALISAGVPSISVWKRPKVAIIPTGSELIPHGDLSDSKTLKVGQIIESNSALLAGLVQDCDAIPIVYDIVADIEDNIRVTLKQAIQSDAHMVIVNAGSSAGTEDHTVHIIREMGEVLVHGVAMMPGKPTILAVVNGKPVVGSPGYGVSAAISFEQFVAPMLYRLQGRRVPSRPVIKVQPTRHIPSTLGLEEFLRVSIGKVGANHVATPLPRAAGDITTLTKAEGVIRIPAHSEGIMQDEESDAELLVDWEDLADNIVFIGSHDMTIDLLVDEIRRCGHDIRISVGNVGSLGGLIALRKGICHMSGTHLLDTETDQYNLSYVKKYIQDLPVSIFHLVLRQQGLMVAKGNPKQIKGVEDLVRSDIAFVNRQAGSGTRVLLDYKLHQQGIQADAIRGYDREEFTHMAVAVDIVSGSADCGMGIMAAAKALNLDFIPIAEEQYDLVIPSSILDQPNVQAVLTAARSRRFRERVAALGGYDPSRSGQLWVKVFEE